jgi:HAD superfamily hydrolase (TIGR01509 family)
MIQAIIFDMGGVLAQDVWEHMYLNPEQGLAARFGIDANQARKIGLLLWESYAYVPETRRNGWNVLEQRYWSQFMAFFGEEILPKMPEAGPQFFIQETERFLVPVAGVQGEVSRLHEQGKALAICSDNNEFWFRRQMDKCGLHRFFNADEAALSCRVGVSKASPRFEMFHAAMAAVRTPASGCLFIDDRQGNVDRAKACGMDAILFTSARDLGPDLRNRGL